ncbi:hypothetical protein PHYSODRAFT_285818 [Phytophthora sojae]|uniref:Uncharacterized protein n=1 Tax=Phytophthora sojae (strain P6497) TaxID=1094619 RepID=G4ZFV5_PHYSP|nr:hypothetical protein PHYSODRAFT_285818 [Phytophthora sojae]EGZ16639.1 hypothetical protein PHYSODRAFT_285818 [Phytophthora sojae]|eukprot:XP_009525697.1 hypothetical protein PHYSODRAFT_285818 [Phytophthora sojae]
MLKRFFRLREFISADDEDLADYLSSRTAHRNLASLLDSLRDVESVSKRLQADGLTLLDARNLCDGLIEIRPSFAKYLASDAEIVHSPDFEQAVVKVLGGQAALLSEEEEGVLEPFKRRSCNVSIAQPQPEATEGFAERILKRRKVRDAPVARCWVQFRPPRIWWKGCLVLLVRCFVTSVTASRR